jgi:very-short-patch-repair endonuclease
VTVTELTVFVSTLAASQLGLVRTNQVPADERARLRHLARRGVIVHAAKGVYRVRGSPVSWEQRLTAAAWALGREAVVSYVSAARWHGLEGFADDRLEFTLPRAVSRRATPGAIVHATEHMPRADVRRVRGLPVTAPARTILDLARAGESLTRLERAIDSAIELRLVTLDRLVDRVTSIVGPGRWGLAVLDEALLDAGGHTVLERAFLRLVRLAGLPRPRTQVVHRETGRHVARVDFQFPGRDLVVEVSGGRGHSSPAERAKDAVRRNDLQRLGRRVIEFTYEQVVRCPDEVIATLRAFLQ